MKILIVQDYLRSGGTERQSVLLANAFSAAGHDTTLLTFRPGGALESTVNSGARRIALQTADTTLDWFAPRLADTAQKLQPDIILCMGRMANCYAGGLQKRCRNSSVIATMRTGKPLPWLFRRSLQRVRHVVANSHDARSALIQRHRVPADKISVIHNSLVFPAETSLGRNDELRAQHGATATTTVLLCVAMFRPEKNQRELVETVATFPPALDWQLWLAGDGPARDACEQLVTAHQLQDRVIFPGFLRDPSPLYRAADVAVHASASESLSNFLIEAQAHGLPAVAYSVQGIAETFRPDRTGWEIRRDDRAAFRKRIELLARAPVSE
ncbi:MAG TPA: glycosyltransferase, partial [Opitutus sp.]|nr:glycosyltransferase [Opitutus sp.]